MKEEEKARGCCGAARGPLGISPPPPLLPLPPVSAREVPTRLQGCFRPAPVRAGHRRKGGRAQTVQGARVHRRGDQSDRAAQEKGEARSRMRPEVGRDPPDCVAGEGARGAGITCVLGLTVAVPRHDLLPPHAILRPALPAATRRPSRIKPYSHSPCPPLLFIVLTLFLPPALPLRLAWPVATSPLSTPASSTTSLRRRSAARWTSGSSWRCKPK